MKFTLVVMRGPGNGRCQERAQRFAQAVVAQGCQLGRVFFYGDGTRAAAPDNAETAESWAAIATEQDTDLVLCSASAEYHGALSPPAPFVLMGLGALMEAGFDSERIISFD